MGGVCHFLEGGIIGGVGSCPVCDDRLVSIGRFGSVVFRVCRDGAVTNDVRSGCNGESSHSRKEQDQAGCQWRRRPELLDRRAISRAQAVPLDKEEGVGMGHPPSVSQRPFSPQAFACKSRSLATARLRAEASASWAVAKKRVRVETSENRCESPGSETICSERKTTAES